MNRKLLIVILALVCGITSQGMTVEWKDSVLSITSIVSDRGDTLHYEFKKCMSNRLFTFSRVELNGKVVNEATSDNIGPFLLENQAWTGGNHLMPDGETPSAHTISVQLSINKDKHPITDGYQGEANIVNVTVQNDIINPLAKKELFCKETINYTISLNVIEVDARHDYCNEQPITVSRYYGLQSMACGETEIRTLDGKYSQFTPVAQVDRFMKKEYPHFQTFVEKMPAGYQVTELYPYALGTHYAVEDNDVVFIGNSYGKCYHKLMGNYPVQKGMTTYWKGAYLWISNYVIK